MDKEREQELRRAIRTALFANPVGRGIAEELGVTREEVEQVRKEQDWPEPEWWSFWFEIGIIAWQRRTDLRPTRDGGIHKVLADFMNWSDINIHIPAGKADSTV